MSATMKRSDASAFYERLANELEEVSNQARGKIGNDCEVVDKLRLYAERIRRDLNRGRV